jgi:hypothetical protein
MPKTREEILEADRIRHKKRYEEKKEKLRQEALDYYYKRKEKDPTFHPNKTGRPRKTDV